MVAQVADIIELPAEITESIIDCLHNDQDALKTCALTHPCWLHRARYHLHKSVSLDDSTSPDKLSGYYDTGAAAYIRNLTLVAPPQPYAHSRRGSMTYRARHLWTVASRFTNVTNLTLVFFDWRGAYKSYERLAEICRNVTHLTLVISSFDNFTDFLSFLCSFPRLVSLSVSSLTFRCAEWGTSYAVHSDEGLPKLELPVTPNLRSVHFSNTHPCPSVSMQLGLWLNSLPRQVIAKSDLTWTGAGSVYGLKYALHGLGANLAHIELDATSAAKLAYEDENGLCAATALESMTIRDFHYIAREEVRWLVLLLARTASAFRKVQLVCTSSNFEGVDEFSLEILDDFLAVPIFSCLEEVILTFGNVSPQKDLPNAVKQGLRRLGERGVLRAAFPAYTVEAEK